MPGSFLDSNVFLYLTSDEEPKRRRCRELTGRGGTISVQVLNEVANVGRRKHGLSWGDVHELLDSIRLLFDVVPVTIETHDLGLAFAQRYGLATYDSMIAAAAVLSGCDVLWSEDMHHGLRIAGKLTITNPFRAM